MLENIKGIGPKTLEFLKELNINTVSDLLAFFPYRYNYYKPSILNEAPMDETILINGYISSNPKIMYFRNKKNKISFLFKTGEDFINVEIFNRAFLKSNLILNKYISIIGKYNKNKNIFMASDIKLTPITSPAIEPVYHLGNKIKKSVFKKIIDNALNEKINIINSIPNYLIEKYKLMNKKEAIKEIHNPTSSNNFKNAKLMLTYEELFEFGLKINYLKKYKMEDSTSYIKSFEVDKVNKLINNLPFILTSGQVNAIEEIKNDFNSKKRMNRLVIGDVGSGKTIVAFISLYMNYLSGYQGMMMAPTEILAKQHYENIIKIFPDLNIKLLTSSITKKERDLLIKDIDNTDILIGTHSLINDEIIINNLGLVITDEQHRFGVNQRKNLEQKGKLVDVLYLSATPIPRTLALSLYGDMDISEIKTKPNNRKEIKTSLYKTKEIKNVLFEMLNELKADHQIYVVCPIIEDDDEMEMESVTKLKRSLDIAFNGKVPMDILHGKLKPKEKEKIMKDFEANRIKVLISTTVIEVGVDVQNATMMVIYNAERFGLATLHQLRGRIGRNDLESKCILISDKDTPRLKILCESNDGFYISEKDFELRGSGDLFGVKQHGDMNFKIANLKNDYKILLTCLKDSKEFLENYNLNDYLIQKSIIDSIKNLN